MTSNAEQILNGDKDKELKKEFEEFLQNIELKDLVGMSNAEILLELDPITYADEYAYFLEQKLNVE